MECKVSDLVKRGHDQAAELKSSCGAVDVRDVAQLISDLATQLDVQLVRSNALAAEYARLSDIAKGGAFVMQKALMKYEFGVGMTMQAEDFIRDVRSKTPATDAFLAEVRASELDSLAGVAETMLIKFSNQQCSSDMHEVVGWKMVLQQAANRAAQLRKGAAL
ncbi:hypothetical protein RRU95_004152 [Salmonella enterica]|uniref:Uncharacterized protein n=1 Tax=Salmonella enterica TaxID=28901 RepID=A0A633IUN3_SALER|nr:hypothetical protein [Salmonella enterica]ECI0979056.1 hypothetical protein [Salmonella enterica subsp. enterica serovar Newport]EDQ4467157.1 hypothetical protein [Salmonella enterica subsp. enterica serovar Javiana]EED5527152.1 hypothetical protein [Salmonella enterica subsp. enterica serovar Muenchen]EAM5866690.1 hypothetical protein [Salmonella enterica]